MQAQRATSVPSLSQPRDAQAGVWWSWGESNPRPKAFVRQIYTLSWLICF